MIINGIECPDTVDWDGVRECQDAQLRSFRAIAEICEKNGLRYYLASGNLIGVMRHSGQFIPWDDDVDIVLFRDDYDRLVEILSEDNGVRVYNWLKDSDYNLWFTKAAVINDFSEPRRHEFIDIFPLDYIPRSMVRRLINALLRTILINVTISRAGKQRGYRVLLYGLFSIILRKFDIIAIRSVLERFVMRGKRIDGNSRVGAVWSQYGAKEYMPEYYYGLMSDNRALFCGVKARIAENPEKCLEHMYGDWRKLPPIEKRVPKHESDDSWFLSGKK